MISRSSGESIELRVAVEKLFSRMPMLGTRSLTNFIRDSHEKGLACFEDFVKLELEELKLLLLESRIS